MISFAIQVEDIDAFKKAMDDLGIKDVIDFEKDKPGIYAMSIEPFEMKELMDYSDVEIEDEARDRGFIV
jgi:hypothetical protein